MRDGLTTGFSSLVERVPVVDIVLDHLFTHGRGGLVPLRHERQMTLTNRSLLLLFKTYQTRYHHPVISKQRAYLLPRYRSRVVFTAVVKPPGSGPREAVPISQGPRGPLVPTSHHRTHTVGEAMPSQECT